jgi:hypothetical protein
VPDFTVWPPLCDDAVMLDPGAKISVTTSFLFEKLLMPSAFVLLPTAVAFRIHAGLEMPDDEPLFPDATTTSILAFRTALIDAVNVFPESHASLYTAVVPMLIEITLIFNRDALFTHQSILEIIALA